MPFSLSGASTVSSTRVQGAGVLGRLRPGAVSGAAGEAPGVVGGRQRRRFGLVWAGAAVVVASSVGFAAVLAHAGRRVPVLAVERSVPAGAVVTAGDVRQVRLGLGDGALHVVPAGDEEEVVGRTAVVPLVAGELLAPGEVGGRVAYPPAGKAQVSVAVDPGGLPAGLAAGDRVGVLPGADAAVPADEPGEQAVEGSAVVGVVTDVVPEEQDATGGSVVTVLVDTAAAGRVARIGKPHLVVLSSLSREVP